MVYKNTVKFQVTSILAVLAFALSFFTRRQLTSTTRNSLGFLLLIAFFPQAHAANGTVSIQSIDNYYLRAAGSGGSSVYFDRTAVGSHEKWTLIDLGNNQVAFQCNNGNYLVAEGGGGGTVNCNRTAIGSWEKWTLVSLGNGQSAIRCQNGNYLVAESGGGGAANCNRTAIGPWEKFRVANVAGVSNPHASAHSDYTSVKDCQWWDAFCAIEQHSNRYDTKYPIVLVHGLSGFDELLIMEMFHQIPGTLRNGGAKVYVPNVSAWNGVEARGEQLLHYIEAHVLPHSGAGKVNLIGHSMGSLTSRYVAAVKPGIVASSTSVHGVNYGSHFADFMLYKLLPEDSPLYQSYINFMDNLLGAVGAVIDFIATGQSWDQDAMQASVDLSTDGNAALNAKYPAGAVTSHCGNGPEIANNGVRYYSWGGIGGVTNVIDPTDYLMQLVATATANEQSDGLVGRCSQHWGKVLRDDYNMNHLDAANMLLGMTGLTDAKDLYENHASRLRNKGL